jgi:transcriptional regulator with XRE-family HTH domain
MQELKNSTTVENLPSVLRKYRVERGYSTAQAAIECGIAIRFYREFESGERPQIYSLGMARRIEFGLGIPQGQLTRYVIPDLTIEPEVPNV